eukprot:gene20257-biopygen19101
MRSVGAAVPQLPPDQAQVPLPYQPYPVMLMQSAHVVCDVHPMRPRVIPVTGSRHATPVRSAQSHEPVVGALVAAVHRKQQETGEGGGGGD